MKLASLILAAALALSTSAFSTSVLAAAPAYPQGVHAADDGLVDTQGMPLYTFNHDTMVGMSHCEGDCATMWPPLKATGKAKPAGDWSLVTREDGSQQWAYKTKPLYTYSGDKPGQPATGLAAPNWSRAK